MRTDVQRLPLHAFIRRTERYEVQQDGQASQCYKLHLKTDQEEPSKALKRHSKSRRSPKPRPLASDEPQSSSLELQVASLVLFPGNLTIPRREAETIGMLGGPRRQDYKGEEDFGGPISYGMFDETDYDALTRKTAGCGLRRRLRGCS